ncbi:hypothetical protein GCM10007079_07180 [Nocardiopsis terrae]|uniref:Phosphodiesterase n=1 Tax=Nocardiopsis terrae TaxID=372655 RepID=A0ABR9HP47_9ACTN|nr:metallophosphoesterase family protein [Nocardiopsis terrae]MBE1460763.1 putative phosphodiesterase [Nocardiopsis terrae]GHC73343.1 hypothetical protein GCM10007079_07180 [Nocardiopsis terrae]
MRYAIVTDIHGDVTALRAVVHQVERQGVDGLLCLGDVFECLVSKRDVTSHVFGGVSEVFDPDPEVAALLEGAAHVRGNQEERIASLIPGGALPDWARPLIHAPLERRTSSASFCHGHTLSWHQPEPGLWSPVAESALRTLLVHGHHHRSVVHRLHADPDGVRSERVPFRFGVETHLSPDVRHIVNVGSVRGPAPAWAVMDEEALSLTHHRVGGTP